MNKYIDQILSKVTHDCFPGEVKLSPELFWSICRDLEEAGFVHGDAERVGILSIGPFKLALAPNKGELLLDFIINTLPTIIKALSKGLDAMDVAYELLPSIFGTFIGVAKSASRINDPNLWCILIWIKEQNNNNIQPTAADIVIGLEKRLILEPNVELSSVIDNFIDKLQTAQPLLGDNPIKLITINDEGKIISQA